MPADEALAIGLVDRVVPADQVYDEFVQRFVARTKAMRLGAGHDWAIDMGSLISQDQLDTVVAQAVR